MCSYRGCAALAEPGRRRWPAHANSWQTGAKRAMPPGWAATRRRVLARDAHRCRKCGAPAAEVHHVVRGVEGDDNLLSLCRVCHHAETVKQRAAGNADAVTDNRYYDGRSRESMRS